jgi:hypothetical protein
MVSRGSGCVGSAHVIGASRGDASPPADFSGRAYKSCDDA